LSINTQDLSCTSYFERTSVRTAINSISQGSKVSSFKLIAFTVVDLRKESELTPDSETDRDKLIDQGLCRMDAYMIIESSGPCMISSCSMGGSGGEDFLTLNISVSCGTGFHVRRRKIEKKTRALIVARFIMPIHLVGTSKSIAMQPRDFRSAVPSWRDAKRMMSFLTINLWSFCLKIGRLPITRFVCLQKGKKDSKKEENKVLAKRISTCGQDFFACTNQKQLCRVSEQGCGGENRVHYQRELSSLGSASSFLLSVQTR
jgi:hypothetical protein